jgi:hypothetical protein
MTWEEAIVKVLGEEKRQMNSNEITELIINKDYWKATKTPLRI